MRKGYGILHRLYNSKDLYYKEPFGAVAEQTDIRFRFCAPRSLAIKEALLIVDQDGSNEISFPAQWVDMREGLDVFECHYSPPEPGLYFYRFCLICWSEQWLFLVPDGKYGRLSDSKDGQYQLSVFAADYETPVWMRGGLMYQIFPDRFCRSAAYDLAETLKKDERARIGMNKDYTLREDWGGLPVYKPNQDGKIMNNDFFGGNLQGIIEKLPYLHELGVTILYLNPIFEAFSTHRYDTSDYLRIDPMLGTLEDFEALCRAAGEFEMRVILDGVFNHTGSDSIYFNKNGRYPGRGAYQGELSPYYSWYGFSHFPDTYSSWWGIDTLPQVNEDDPSYMDYIMRGQHAVVKTWIRRGAAGFRLDVADELPPEFLDILREAIKSEKSDAVIIGEVWEDASNKVAYGRRTHYFWGKELDSVMNYPLKDSTIDFLSQKINGYDFCFALETLRENYPKQVFYGTMNLLGTHDTVRILTVLSLGDRIWMLSRDDKAALHEHMTEQELFAGKQKLFMALLIWAFFPGIPCLYYGDELGMQGAEDPFNRQCFDERTADAEVFSYYKDLLAFRKSLGNFGEWTFSPLEAGVDWYGFMRTGDQTSGAFAVLINRGAGAVSVRLPLAKNQETGRLFSCGNVASDNENEIRLSALSGAVIEIKQKEGGKTAYADI